MAPYPARGRERKDSTTAARLVGPKSRVVISAPTALLLASLLWSTPGALAFQSPGLQSHPEAQEAISKLRSPFCPGLMLEVCPTPNAQALRDSIDADARLGLTADSLVEKVVAAYGEEYRAFPKRTGAGLLAWVMPPAGLLLGLGLVIVALRRLRGPARADGSSAEALTGDEQARLDAALADLEVEEEEDA